MSIDFDYFQLVLAGNQDRDILPMTLESPSQETQCLATVPGTQVWTSFKCQVWLKWKWLDGWTEYSHRQ